MAAQQTIIAETIRGMKLAMRRHDTDSDSDTTITQPTNRGNKLKRNARHVREGRLDTTHGRSYKKRVDYAGYDRYILNENPLRFDDDGDLIDDDEYDNEDEDNPDKEDNPWAATKLEELLAPLTSAADLAEHPSLSVPFLSRPISEMAENARQAMHREKQTLTHIKQLLLRLRGDDHWIPVGKLESEHDMMLLDPSAAPVEDSMSTTMPPETHAIDHYRPDPTTQTQTQTQADPSQQNGTQPDGLNLQNPSNTLPSPDASPEGLTQHAMTTRRQARTSPTPDPNFPSSSPAPSSLPSIHGFFHVPDSALPDRDYGLPATEADDTRRLLLLYCQKQEQVVRESEQMLEGLLKADRMRKDVWRWCKTEGHAGEMSDGEDWYDMDEWNLSAPLQKGKEEEEVEDEGRVKGRRRRGAQH
ncbi:hypothetical protein D6D18_09259 [Aureobasidium pullulans]|nr:hypothetical protein D6D18_09259 [Aureobasidium pullulans]